MKDNKYKMTGKVKDVRRHGRQDKPTNKDEDLGGFRCKPFWAHHSVTL